MKNKIFQFLTFKRILFLLLFIFISSLALIYFLGGYNPVSPNYYAEPFSKEGFIFYEDFSGNYLSDEYQKLFENENLIFWFNYQNTTFRLEEKETGKVWNSNPPFPDDFNNGRKLEENQKSTLNIYYIGSMGATRLYNNYSYSISKENVDKEVLIPDFALKIDEETNTLQVLYILKTRGIDYSYFPYKISKERMDEVIARNQALIDSGELSSDMLLSRAEILLLTSEYFELKKETQDDGSILEYYIRKGSTGPEDIKLQVRQRLYLYLYDKCHYTREDAEKDNAMFNISMEVKRAEFEVAIQYRLKKEGLNVKVLSNSIKETEDYPLAYIEILPYLTASHYSETGYMVIPDGSGAILNYNNGKTTYPQYSKRIYSRDLASPKLLMSSTTEDILLPMFAIVNQSSNSGMLVDVIQGAAQMRISADISKRTEAFNKIYLTGYYRESQQVTIGTDWYATEIVKWTVDRVESDFEIDYLILNQDELNYSRIAKRYQSILIDRYDIEKKDETEETVINVDLIGAYNYQNHFLGIGYQAFDTMTSFRQIETIVNSLFSQNVNHINLFLKGWREKGLIDESFKDMSFQKRLGKSDALTSLITFLNENEVDLYPYVNFGEINDYQEAFGKNHYTVRDVTSAYVVKYPYNFATYLYDETKNPIYPISPKYYNQFMENLISDYDFGFPQMSFDILGGKITGDYEKHHEFFRISAVNESIKALELAKANLEKLSLYAPYDYAIPYTNVALSIPYRSTSYEILDYSIPFYQLVVSGLFDYSGLSINANDEKGLNYHIMRMLETGSNPAFTFTFEDSAKLIQTDYNYYYYTEYDKWLNEVKSVVQTLDEARIHDKTLISHELIANNTFKVIYENNIERVTIYLNYSEGSIYLNSLDQTLAPLSYVCEKESLI